MSRGLAIRENLIKSILLVFIFIPAALSIFILQSGRVDAGARNGGRTLPSPTPSPIVTNNSQLNNGIDPTLLDALTNGFFAIAGAIIGVFGATQAVKKAHELQQQKEKEEAIRQKQQNERDRIEANKAIDSQIQNYRTGLSTDSDITHLQILFMDRPIAVTSIYVRLKLNKDTRHINPLDKELIEAQVSDNTEKLIQRYQKHLEERVKDSLDPDKAICDYKHCVIVGDPGSGKTTLLKYLAIKSVTNDLKELPNLPIYIELIKFAKSPYNDLLDFIDSRWTEQYGFSAGTPTTYLRSELKHGNVLVLLDGLDATSVGGNFEEAEKTYNRVRAAIQHFHAVYHQTPIVVTVRKAKYQQGIAFTDFTELEVLDFRRNDIEQFVDNWFAADPQQAKDLNSQIRLNPHIQALAANPLLLSLITLVYKAPHELPRRRANLYQRCLDILITKWDDDKSKRSGIGRYQSDLTSEQLEILLEEIAWYFHTKRQHYFPKEDLLKIISITLPAMRLPKDRDPHHILEEITNTNGLLKEQAKDWYGFFHLTFQEYFVSLHIAYQGLSDKELAYSDDPWWEEAILLSAGHRQDASFVLNRLQKKTLKDDVFHANLIFAGRYLAASSRVGNISLQEEIISLLLDTLIKVPYSLTQQKIASTLIEMSKPEINERLITLLYGEHISQKTQAIIADAFGTSSDRSISSRLLPLLSDVHITKDIAQRIAIAQGKLSNASDTDKLLQLISEPDIDEDVRGNIICSLGMFEEENITDKLVDLLTHHPDDWKLQVQVIDTISKSGKNSLAHGLRSQLSEQIVNPDVRIHIIDALSALNDKSSAIDLLKLLLEPNTQLKERLCIVDNLSKVGDSSTIMSLKEMYQKSQIGEDIHQCIAMILTRLGDRGTIRDLLQFLTDLNVQLSIRQSIAVTLVKLADPSINDQLLKLVSDAQIDITMQKCIIDTMSTLDDCSLASTLMPMAFNPKIDLDIRTHIAYTIVALGEQLTVANLLPLFSNDKINTQICQLIIDKLGENGDSSQVPELLTLLSNQKIDKNMRKSVVNAIGNLASDEATTRMLAESLETSDIKDDIHGALWKISHKAKVRISMIDSPSGKTPNISKNIF